MKRSLTVLFFVLLNLIFSVVKVTAQDSSIKDNKDHLSACLGNVNLSAFKNNQFADCYSEELKRQDSILNKSFKALKERISDLARVNQIVKAQQAWILYRDRWCDFAESSDQAPSHEVNRLDCLVSITNTQIKLISEAEK